MRRLLILAVAMATVLAFGYPAWAGTNLCKGPGKTRMDYPIPMDMVAKLKIYASCREGRLHCVGGNSHKGSYLVNWDTGCSDPDEKAGTLSGGESVTLYMPVCSKGGAVTVRATSGCIEVVDTTSYGY